MRRLDRLTLDRLLQRAERTPFYAIDGQAVYARVDLLRSVLPASLQLCFAVKANPLPALLSQLSSQVDGVDVSSAGELQRALDAGFNAASIGFTGPGKREPELAAALSAGVRICAESKGEIQRIAHLSERLGVKATVALRINPAVDVSGTRIRMAGDSFFGIDCSEARAALALLRDTGLSFGGLHFYCASQLLDAGEVIRLHEHCSRLALTLADALHLALPWLNLGGGFGVPLEAAETPLDIRAVGAALHAIAERVRTAHPEARLALEPGRYLVAEAGHYVCAVIDRKTVRGRLWLIVDGGAHQHLHATLQPDRLKPANFPMTLFPQNVTGERERVSIAGPLCAPFDVLARDIDLPRAEPGDLLVVHCSGAYGASASPVNFLGHPPPAELLF